MQRQMYFVIGNGTGIVKTVIALYPEKVNGAIGATRLLNYAGFIVSKRKYIMSYFL